MTDETAPDTETVYDVVQIGFGPVSQVLSLALGRKGHSVAVFERHQGLYKFSRAGHLDHEIMRILQGVGAADDVIESLIPATVVKLLDAEREELVSFSGGATSVSGWFPDFGFYQPDIERVLLAHIEQQRSVVVHHGWEIRDYEQHEDHVVVTVAPTGSSDPSEARRVRARYLVGADGANSSTRGLMGKSWDRDFGFEGSWLVCDFEHKDPDLDLGWDVASQILDPKRPITAARWIGRRHSRLEFMLMPDDDPAEFKDEAFAWRLAAPLNIDSTHSILTRHAVYTFRSLLLNEWRDRRVLLAGDSAHLMPPFMGQGMCSGLRDAWNLAWKLDLVLGGSSDGTLLDSYTIERVAHVATVIEMTVFMGGAINVTDPVAAAARNEMLRTQGMPDLPAMPGLRDGILHRRADGGLAKGVGELGIQGRIRHGDRVGLFDDVLPANWQIISRRALSEDDLSAPHRELLRTVGGRVTHVSPAPVDGAALDLDYHYRDYFATLGARTIIVRPDYYVFAAVDTLDELAAALDDLAQQLSLQTISA